MGNGPEFFQTVMGHKFYEGTVPALVRELKRLNDNLERIYPIEEGPSCKRCGKPMSNKGLCKGEDRPHEDAFSNKCKGCFSELLNGRCTKRTCDYHTKAQPE